MKEGSTSASRNMSDPHIDSGIALQVNGTADLVRSEKGKYELNNLMLDKDINNVAVSDKLYLHKLQESSVNGENCKTCHSPNSEGLSKYAHFPLYGINQKIWAGVNPNKGPEFEQMAGRFVQSLPPPAKSTIRSHLTEFAAAELHYVAESSSKSCEQEIEPFECVKELLALQAKFAASTSQLAIDRLKLQTPKVKSPLFFHNETIPSTSDTIFDEHSRRISLINMTRELCAFTSQSRVTASVIKKVHESADSTQSSWSKGKSGSMQVMENPWPGNLPFPSVVGKKDEYIQHLSSKSPPEDRATVSVETAKANGGALFETLTVPVTSWSHEKRQGNPPPLTSSNKNGKEENAIERMTATRKRSFTDTVDVDSCKTSSPLGGMIPDGLQKDLMHTDLVKWRGPTPIQWTAIRHATSLEKTHSASNKEPNSSRTESINEDRALYHVHVQRSNGADSACIAENSTQGPLTRWLKRLGPTTDEFATDTKRTKIVNNSPSTEVCGLSSKANNCSVSTSDTREYLQQHQTIETTKKLPKTLGSSYGPSSEKMQHWIKRWCHIPCGPGGTVGLPDNLEKKNFPSIGAMALMGKAMHGSRQKGKFRRRGALVVWKTEGL